MTTILHAHLQIVADNTNGTIKAIEIKTARDDISVGDALENIANELIGVRLVVKRISEKNLIDEDLGHANLIIGYDLSANKDVSFFNVILKK